MRNVRFLLFLLSVVFGIVAGLIYGWVINPRAVSTTPERLRSDFRTDYVLMVAEVYRTEGDSALAAHRLAFLGEGSPVRMVQEAIIAAGEMQYAPSDLSLMVQLAKGLSQTPAKTATGTPEGTPEGGTP